MHARASRLWWLVLSLSAGSVACSSDDESARIDVVVREGDRGVPDLETLRLRVIVPSPAGDEEARQVTSPARYDATGRLAIWTSTISPMAASDVGRVVYRVRAEGLRAGEVVVAAQARVTFVAGARQVLPLTFHADCVAVTCGPDETCVTGGRCVDDYVPSCGLSAEGCGMDASMRDAGDAAEALDASDAGEPLDAADVGPASAPDASDSGPDASDSGPDASDSGPDASDSGPDARPRCLVDAECTNDDLCDTDVCVLGDCVHDPIDCADGEACTDERCDPAVGCISTRRDCGVSATCSDGACACDDGHGDCDRMLGCETDLMSDPTSCGACGNACPPSTPSCVGGTCVACATAADCPADALACTAPPTCTTGVCAQSLMPGFCLIGGVCHAADAPNPANQCQRCDPTMPTGWTARTGACDDGRFCTRNDACVGGTCTATTAGVCFDIRSCTHDFCDEETDSCSNPVRAGFCLIASACYAAGAHRPIMGDCWVCDPSRSQTEWSPDVGAPCSGGAGFVCTGMGNCCSPTSDGGPMLCTF